MSIIFDFGMATFTRLRLILQDKKPDLKNFITQLDNPDLISKDYDLLLRKAVEEKVMQFG